MLDLLGSITANGAGTIEVCLMADGFTGTSPLSFGFVANGQSTHGITLSDTLLINGMAQQASTNTVTLAPGFSQGVSNTVTITPNSSPFTLENCITITFGRGGGTVSFDKLLGQQGVPDSGMTASLLGIGLLAIAGRGQAAPDEGNCLKQRFSDAFQDGRVTKSPCRFVSGIKVLPYPLVANMLISRIKGAAARLNASS